MRLQKMMMKRNLMKNKVYNNPDAQGFTNINKEVTHYF